MEKGDTFPLGAKSWNFINEAYTGRLAARERCIEVINGKTDVMDAGAAVGDELADRRIVSIGLEELNKRLTGLHARDMGAIGVIERDFGHAEEVAVEGQDVVQGPDSNANVGNSGGTFGSVSHG